MKVFWQVTWYGNATEKLPRKEKLKPPAKSYFLRYKGDSLKNYAVEVTSKF